MYLDVNGRVTIGIGHLIATEADAQRLALYKAGGTPASSNEIRIAYQRMKGRPYGATRGASTFAAYATLSMTRADIYALRDAHIATFEQELKLIYPAFDSYPSNVRLALFDMIFNLGMTELRTGWPRPNCAIKSKNWKDAARESNRSQIARDRNNYVMRLFESAQ